MRLLFAISVASFCTVLSLALALARRIRRDQGARKQPPAPTVTAEFFEAGEFRTPRALRLNQDVSQQGVRRNLEVVAPLRVQPDPRREGSVPLRERAAVTPAPAASAPAPTSPRQPAPEAHATPVRAADLPEAVIIDSTLQFVMARQSPPVETASPDIRTRDISGERKSPQSARSGSFRRVDLSHYNKELGDLTDPYTHSVRGSGVRPSVAKNG